MVVVARVTLVLTFWPAQFRDCEDEEDDDDDEKSSDNDPSGVNANGDDVATHPIPPAPGHPPGPRPPSERAASEAGIPAVQSGSWPGIKCTKRDPKRDPNRQEAGSRKRGAEGRGTGRDWLLTDEGREDGWVEHGVLELELGAKKPRRRYINTEQEKRESNDFVPRSSSYLEFRRSVRSRPDNSSQLTIKGKYRKSTSEPAGQSHSQSGRKRAKELKRE